MSKKERAVFKFDERSLPAEGENFQAASSLPALSGSALEAARTKAKPFAVEWQGTRRDTCHAIGEKMLYLNHKQAARAWTSLAHQLIRLGDRDIPKFVDIVAGINAATMVGGIGVQNDGDKV